MGGGHKLVKFRPFVIKILSGNKVLISIKSYHFVTKLPKMKVLISIKSYHFVTKLPKMIVNNTELDLVNINA